MPRLVDHIKRAVEDMSRHMLRQIEQGLHFIAQHGVQQMRLSLVGGRQVFQQLLGTDLHALGDLRLIEELTAQTRLQLGEALKAERLRRAHDRRWIDADRLGDFSDGQVDHADAAFQQKARHLALAGRERIVVAADPADDVVWRF